jgi:hypothetical protein
MQNRTNILQLDGNVLLHKGGALCYKPEGRGFESRWGHWIFQLTSSIQPHYGPGIDSASNRNGYQDSFWE